MAALFKKINWFDVLVVSAFFLYALMYFLGRWSGMPEFNFLEGDIANSTSFAAALDSPDLFKGDLVLGDLNNFKVYWVIQSWLIRKLYLFTGHYGLATCFMLGPHIFIHFLSFYILGRAVFRHRGWALVLSLLTAHFVPFKLGDFWGIYFDILPRFTFQALWPFLLALAFLWREQHKKWPFLMILAGLLMYVHPVSTPGIAFSIWCGFWFFIPKEWSVSKRLLNMFLVGCVFLATVAPFMFNYLSNFDHGIKPNYDVIYPIMVMRYAVGYFDIPYALKRFVQHMWMAKVYFPGLLSLIILYFWRKGGERKQVLLVGSWFAGVCIIGMLVPLVEQEICKYLKALPPEIDLVRTIRYTIPLSMLGLVWLCRDISFRLNKKLGSSVPAVLFAALAAWFLVKQGFSPTWGYPKRTLNAWKQGELIPEPMDGMQEVNANLAAIRNHVPLGVPVFVVEGVDDLAVRYSALRPVVYSFKDGGILGYANHNKLIKWKATFDRFQESYGKPDPLRAYYRMARNRGAEFMVVGWLPESKRITETEVRDKIEILYSNQWKDYKTRQPLSMTLLKLNP